MQYNLEDTEIGYKLQEHFGDISIIIQALDLFALCLEEETYVNTHVELYSFIKIIIAYLKNIKESSVEIEKELNIL